jgi:hypothetical protein
MWRLASFLRVRGLQRGVFGGNRYWFAVWAGLGVASFFHKRLGKQVVAGRIQLRSGETVVIRDTGVPRDVFGSLEP